MSDDAPDVLTIHQLEAASGVPARRIRHFVSEGLLAPPVGKGRAAHYTGRHLERLRQIQALRDGNLGLDEIKRRLGEPVEPLAPDSGPSAALWRRWEIAPGLELHARTDLDRDVADKLQMLVQLARQLMTVDRGDEL